MNASNFDSPQKMFTGDMPEEEVYVKIVGVGGAGNNAVDRLQLDPSSKVRLAAINTDAQALASSPLQEKLMIGRSITRGLSAGGDAKLGAEAAEHDKDAIAAITNGMDMVFILVGLGGGTGSGAAPVVARIAASQGALVIAFVTTPFEIEGTQRKKQADNGLIGLREVCDAVIPLPNDVLMQHLPEEATVLDAFSQADEWINRGVRSICSMLFQTGLINLDFAALKKAFVNKGGKTLFGLGRGQGEDYVNEAINDLSICPLLHIPEFANRADSLLINITGGTDLGMAQVNAVMAVLTEKFGSKQNTVLGAVIDDSLKEYLEICVIGATDVGGKRFVYKPAGSLTRPAPQPHRELPESEPLEVNTASATQLANDKRVHTSKLKKKSEVGFMDSQEEFLFVSEDEHRGYFDNTPKNIFEGEDIDIPTFMRRNVKVHH